ncbi:phosphoketolase [Candidatus Saccharibacteria bacterium RIFCSPHIGHO2_12_FULL_49_19]|nr:MAG: phosphoketolase [Candidatus Saccharibacteria bacterium RIFCSPHIGHO2_12_FULL_49_19]OGL38020.1 MAG: phosphoketolase [Candidatus Saccharibacteria bacterium RIFCSPLOWO2_01_FULL_49_22]
MQEPGGNFDKYLRAANFLTAAQIFLQDNFLLERQLVPDDIKPRLLGHWGSGPGVNFAYSHLSYLAKQENQKILFVLGPGHAFPALQANLFLEGTLQHFYPKATHSYEGIGYICRNFSWPYGFPSHSNPATPGVILEGGELGYSLSTAYGAVLDNPDLLVACLVGDGEAETGPIAAAWHLNKLINPKTNGQVLPILHLNGYKISAPTIFGRMSDDELVSLFKGYGYQPLVVSGENIHQQMQETLSKAYSIFQANRQADSPVSTHPPMIIMRTLKGWTGIKELNGQKIEGNCLSHQVVLTEAKSDPGQLRMLEDWLRSYKINELFSAGGGFGEFVTNIIPPTEYRMGQNRHAFGGEPVYKPLILPRAEQFAEDATEPGTIGSSSMRRAGLYLNEVFKLNDKTKNFRMMSPDETYSNKLDEVFKSTSRAWIWPIESWDKDLDPDGRVMEMLSEHNLQGLAQGYILTGRHAVFASYEAFIQVVASMMDQYAKFLNQSMDVSWRGSIPSLNYILTSSGWRQEHNGFSHQNPGFIDDVLQRQGDFVDVYFPPDGNSMLAVLEYVLSTTRQINVIAAGKTLEPRWLTPELAKKELEAGLMTWDFASDDNPDVVLAAAGDYLTKEALAAIDIVKNELPQVRLRFVNILSLTSCGLGQGGTCLTHEGFNMYFTSDKPVICNFHGYPETIKSIIFDYISSSPQRFSIHGYIESGSTTTPFDMHVRNKTSRWDLVISVLEKVSATGRVPYEEVQHIIKKYQQKLADNTAYIKENGVDMPEIEEWRWTRPSR